MASEWYDYHELKDYLYKLWKGKVWDSLSQEIKRIYWNDLQKLRGEANADMELGGSDEEAFLCALQPDDEDDGKKAKKKRKKAITCALILSNGQWKMELTTPIPLHRKSTL